MSTDSNHSHNSSEKKTVASEPQRFYDENFKVTEDYCKTLPDMQNSGSKTISGAHVPILQVGMSNFRLPLKMKNGSGELLTLEVSVVGTVTLAAENKGINMSRIMRIFYEFKDRLFSLELLEEILKRYKSEIKSPRARLKLYFSYPMLKPSLRSGNEGYQYYDVSYEGILDEKDFFKKIIHFDFVYSSACPCSSDLAEHARGQRNIYSIPHSQRSKARVSVEVKAGAVVSLEAMQKHCLDALKTETQVMVKREDEQAFAEMNGAYVKFVEDAARLLFSEFSKDTSIVDFQIACAHLESLHSHDAVAVVNKGVSGGFSAEFDNFKNLIC